MKRLSKFFLAVLLLTVTAVSWGACPEGQKQTYKGCEVDATPKITWACPKGASQNYNGECATSSGIVVSGSATSKIDEYKKNIVTPGWNGHFTYDGIEYTATTTGGIAKNIVVDTEFKRDQDSLGSIKLNLVSSKCLTDNLIGDDCPSNNRRTQIYTNHWYPTNKDLIFQFSVFKADQGVSPLSRWPSQGLMLFEIKGDYRAVSGDWTPSFHLRHNPQTGNIIYVLELCDVSALGRDTCDAIEGSNPWGKIAKWDYGKWHDFVIETKQSSGQDGYVRVHLNNNLIFSYEGKTTYKNAPDNYWLGPYITDWRKSLASDEPDHTYWFDAVSSYVVINSERIWISGQTD